MGEQDKIIAEFETLGEAEVAQRIEHKLYQDPARAYAMRWLNEKGMARTQAASALVGATRDRQLLMTRRAEWAARTAVIAAVTAAVAASLAIGLAFEARRTVSDLVIRQQNLSARVEALEMKSARPAHL